MFHIRTFLRLGVAGFKVVMNGKTFLDISVLFCRASFRDENFTSAKIFGEFSRSSRRVRNDSFHNSKVCCFLLFF